MAIINISAGRGSIIVIPASEIGDDTVVEADQDAVILVYAEGDATAADAFATALAQSRRPTAWAPVGDRG